MPGDDCYICRYPDTKKSFGRTNDRIRTICDRCGIYEILEMENGHIISQLNEKTRPIISEYIYQQNKLGDEPLILSGDLRALSDRRVLTFAERARRLLVYFYEEGSTPWHDVDVFEPRIQGALQQFVPDYISAIAKHLESKGLVRLGPAMGPGGKFAQPARLTPEGLMQAKEWGSTYTASTQGFVAMWFDDQMKSAWEQGLSPAIIDAGYLPQRIDSKEHNNKICDEIIAEIRKSRFLVADYTGHRGGVYYEAGYALGRDIPVILTCRSCHMKDLRFDVRQYNCIDWKTPEELNRRLRARIEAVVGVGPLEYRN
jgi:hypothetical protein